MVTQIYDAFDRQDSPELTLCNPDKSELYSLKGASSKIIKLRYNATSEIELTLPKEIGGTELPAFELLSQKRLIKVDDSDVGYFVISDVSTDTSADIPIKKIRGLSLEFTMMAKKLSAFGGTMPLHDIITPSNGLLGKILVYVPGWSIGTIDSALLTKFRTFNVADTNIYNFLMTEVSDAYGCIFTFDTTNNEINATAIENVTSQTDVYISHDNLMDSSSFKEVADELTTALYVYGGGDLDIRTVNPLGTNIIYDFSYYKTTDWISQGLIDALDLWEAAVVANQATYASTLASLKISLAASVTLDGELATLNSEYLAIEAVQKSWVEAGLDLIDVNLQLAAKQTEIDSKQTEIDNEDLTTASLRATLTSINDSLLFENNFTSPQIIELSYITYENTYQNENLVQLDSDTPDEVQELSQTLYDQAILILAKISQPRYEFSMDTASILALKEYEAFSSQIELGSKVYVERENGDILNIVLLEMIFDYENPDGFSMTFSNRLRLDDVGYMFSDLFGQPVSTGTKVKFDSAKWENWSGQHKNDVTNFIDSSLDASLNNIISSSDQEVLIYDNGLRIRKSDGSGGYEDEQMWMGNQSLMFTNDNWNTASLAVGLINFNGSPLYGVVADAIVGRLIAGNELHIENDNNNFLLDETGAYLTNATLTLTRDSGKNRISIDPTVGIKIESNISGTWEDAFVADSAGNIIFSGTLSGADGEFSGSITADEGFIGGWEISTLGLEDTVNGNYIRSDGDIKLGNLLISGSSAQFDGDIYADKLVGDVDWSQIVNSPLPASQFNGGSGYSANGFNQGTMSGSRIFGGSLGGNGVSIGLGTTGVPTISGTSQVQLTGGSGSLVLGGSFATFSTFGTLQLEGSSLRIFASSFSINGATGLSKYVYYKDWSDNFKYLRFTNGILTLAS